MTHTFPLEILIAEDDQLITELQKRQLVKLVDSPLKCFWNGKTLMNHLHNVIEERKAVLIFLDINMPVMDGWEVLDQINELYAHKNIFVVMLTSSLFPADKKKALSYPQVISFNNKFLEHEDYKELLNIKVLNPFFNSEVFAE
ncbi:response regulator [Salegentibacter sediminis]|uniref:response regulator n=1 Tax=Salegentibacter sediminis TaxID=1930251 RepID=UPI0009BFB186|nr:response regulator [Salegentibacter sediminis]